MKKNLLWNTIGTFLYTFAQWVLTVLVVRMDSYESAGYLAIAITASSTYLQIALYGMRNFQISDVRGEYQPGEYVGSRFLTCLFAVIACSLISAFSYSGYQYWCVEAFMLIRLAEAFVDVLYGEDQRFDRFDYIGKSYILRGIATIVMFVLGLKLTGDLFIALVLIAICNFLVATIYDLNKTAHLEKIAFTLKSPGMKSLLLTCAPIMIYNVLLYAQNLSPKNTIQAMMDTTQVGYYSSIASPTLVVQLLANVLFTPFLPKIAELYEEKKFDDFGQAMKKTLLVTIGMVVIVNLGAMLLGRWGLKLLYGPDILTHYELFMPLVNVTILYGLVFIMYSIVVILRKTLLLVIGMGVDFALNMIMIRPMVNTFGMNGATYNLMLTYGAYLLYLLVVSLLVVHKEKKRLAV